MALLLSLAGGTVGAATLTALHETARHTIPYAPRVDVIGERALARPLRRAGFRARESRMYGPALAGEFLSNGLYFALAGTGKGALLRGLVLGMAGGLGAAFLPPYLGLGDQPGKRTPHTQVMTVAWYTLGGLAAGAVGELIGKRRSGRRLEQRAGEIGRG